MRRLLLPVLLLSFVALPLVGAVGRASAQTAKQTVEEPAGTSASVKSEGEARDEERIEQEIQKGEVERGKYATAPRSKRGSGFWTSNVPTPNHPYRWSYMAVGMGVCALMGVLVLVLIRRAGRQREEAQAAASRSR